MPESYDEKHIEAWQLFSIRNPEIPEIVVNAAHEIQIWDEACIKIIDQMYHAIGEVEEELRKHVFDEQFDQYLASPEKFGFMQEQVRYLRQDIVEIYGIDLELHCT